MKIKIAFLYFLFLTDFLSAIGDKIDSLKKLSENANHDSVRIKAISQWDDLIYLSNPDLDLELNNKIILLCSANLKKTLKPVEKLFYTDRLAESFNRVGSFYSDVGQYALAIDYYKKSIELYSTINYYKDVATGYNNTGIVYKEMGNYTEAMQYYNKARAISERIIDKEGLSRVYSNIGNLYLEQNLLNEGLNYLNKSYKIDLELDDKIGMSSNLINIGIVYRNIGDSCRDERNTTLWKSYYQKAIEYYNQSLKLAKELNYMTNISLCYNNSGNLYREMGDYDKALSIYQESFDISKVMGDKKRMANTLNNISRIHYEKGDLVKATIISLEAMEIAKKINAPSVIRDIAGGLYEIYQKRGDFKNALLMYEKHVAIKDSLLNENNQRSLIQQQYQYEYEKKAAADSVENVKEQEIKNIAIQKQKVELNAKRSQQYALISGFLIVLIFAGFIFNRFKVTSKQKAIIESQKTLVEEKHKEITDSINYAERIQRSFLASKQLLDENIKDYFVLFQPKDVVSGDFYWASVLNDSTFALVTADSTGHGVPGAIMSILNISCLEKSVEEKQLTSPAEILNYTRAKIIERLKKDGSIEGGKDGMDCSLIVFDFKHNKLTYAAANNPVWIIREKVLIEYAPDKMPVGKHDRDTLSFTQHTVTLQQGDIVYALTDGLPDQFGGPKGKKFLYKQLKEILIANSALPMIEQKERLAYALNSWKGDLEQVDDVCVTGVRIS